MLPHRRVCDWSRLLGLALPALLALGCNHAAAPVPEEAALGPPRLAVLVFFDQLRGDYLERWQDLFEQGGFRRLQEEGAWFRNCHMAHAGTWTAAGHASAATGCPPARHGIVGNQWIERADGGVVYCVGSVRHKHVPPPGPGHDPKMQAGSPERLRAPTLADALKEATGGKARVVALSLKDRSAVLPAGRQPDACYWLDRDGGRFVTSTYYRDTLHPWVAEFNATRPADRWFGRPWNRLHPNLDYERHSSPDDADGEGRGIDQGRTFPHPTTGGRSRPGGNYYEALANSPFGNELLLELAKRAIDAEQLGSREVPDLLAVSFSSNDPIGHCWGPDSQEVLDVTLRSDRIVKGLLDHLDARVGRGRYVLVLTADHGACPLPEAARKQGKDARRISPEQLASQAEEFLEQAFGELAGDKQSWIESIADFHVHLNQGLLRRRGLTPAEVEKALAGWLGRQPGIQTAYTRTQLLAGLPEDDAIGQKLRRSFYPERSGDVVMVIRPYHLLTGGLTGTNHGTPHPYDTHVPLLVYGPRLVKGVRHEEVAPQAAAAILARSLGIEPPSGAETPSPAGLFESD